MLDRTDFESWQQHIRLYCRGKDNGENILKSIDEGPFQMGKFRETLVEGDDGAPHLGPERDRVFADLTPEEKDRYKADIRATNILLLGESIHEYYVMFTKLINDMRNIKMTMSKMQLNSKFVNNMFPEWGRFVTAVKLNRGLKNSNYDQLYAYLKQHEAHANENKMMLEKFSPIATEPLALVSNASFQQSPSHSSDFPQSAYPPQHADNTQLDSGHKPTDNLIETLTNILALLSQSYKAHLPQTNNQLQTSSNTRNQATVQNGKVVVQNVQGRYNRGQGNNARGAVAASNEGIQNRVGGQANTFDADVDEAPVQDMALNEDNIFQSDQCDAFDSDVDEAATTQTMFMENLSSADPIYYEAGPSYDSDIIFEVQDHDNYQDCNDMFHEVHEMQYDVQQHCIVDSNAEHTSDSNLIQYVKENAESVIQSDVSSVPNDAVMMIMNEIYKELVGVYEQRARFVLTEREQKIDEQIRIIITDRNKQETSLKSELHSLKMQLKSTIDHNKSMKAEVATLKHVFKQKEDKYLEDFLNIKALKEKVEDKLYKQDQSLQTIHMLCKPKPYYDEKNKVAIGYKSPLYLTKAMQVQSALYNGHELIKTSHVPAVVHDSEDTLKKAETTRKGMLKKMKSPLWIEHMIKIAPPDYSKENYLTTFTPQRQLTPEQIFWS
ncbi:hypothetical protein Tco_1140366 [Tanacetum coccineum]